MHTLYRWLIGPALGVILGSLLLAQEPAAERTAGKVLLLKNGNAEEGDIVKLGKQMCIRRGKSEVRIGIDRVLRLCADWDDAYRHVEAAVKPATPDDHVALSRWCDRHDLKDKALLHAKLALELNANHREAKMLIAQLERVNEAPAARPSAPAAAPVAASKPAAHLPVAADTLISFTTHVQPILMNKCAACHAGGKFRLDRALSGGQKAITRNNLNVVLGYVDFDRPADSPLLIKAIEAHGNAAAAPLKDRTVVPFQIMQAWIEYIARTDPALKALQTARKPTDASGKSDFGTAGATAAPAPPIVAVQPKPAAPSKQPQAQVGYLNALVRQQPTPPPVQKIIARVADNERAQPAQPNQQADAPAASDPFDPAIFNRAYHARNPN